MAVHISTASRPVVTTAKLARASIATSRILLGSVFTLAGASMFFLIFKQPPLPPGLAGTFATAFFQSHWVVFVDLMELAAGVLLLANRFVPFALVLLAAILSNILVFHITMQPQTLPLPLALVALWIGLAYAHRSKLLALFDR